MFISGVRPNYIFEFKNGLDLVDCIEQKNTGGLQAWEG